jgi:hypothetical protein
MRPYSPRSAEESFELRKILQNFARRIPEKDGERKKQVRNDHNDTAEQELHSFSQDMLSRAATDSI